MPIRLRKRPIEVDAVLWTGDNTEEVRAFVGDDNFLPTATDGVARLWVRKHAELAHVLTGSAIVAEPDGSGFYPVAPDLLDLTFEPVDHPLAADADRQPVDRP